VNAGSLAQGRTGGVVPSTPLAGLEILKAGEIPLAGRIAVVVGRSAIVGRPMALLLLQEHATVTICHSRTPNLSEVTRRADVLVAATGRAGLIDGSMVKPGATIVDFGINVVDGAIVGDVDGSSTVEVAGALTPVPGGTGPVTTAVLARNLLDLAERTLGG
jgi:methylenetetrahydrofolate dehydrogenase (NADP+)/methenyltetrahydrofolate cyclohydrolase